MIAKNSKNDEARRIGLTQKIDLARTYFEESRTELKKVTWPTRTEVRVTTLAVLILVAIMSIFLGVIDYALVRIVQIITSLGV
ncbi:MAG: preprotein translocase subunit SecE [Desulfovibrionaceae bacterium]|nr:preprotein translocase subunit SecE [Desulfovibrionaceae bacterium]